MDLSQKYCETCVHEREENKKLRLLNAEKQEENVKLLFDLSLAKAEYEKEQQIRHQIEKQLADTNAMLDQVKTSHTHTLNDIVVLLVDEFKSKNRKERIGFS